MSAMPKNKFEERDSVASDHITDWSHDTKPRMIALPWEPGFAVDEVHQFDAPYGGKVGLAKPMDNATGQTRRNPA